MVDVTTVLSHSMIMLMDAVVDVQAVLRLYARSRWRGAAAPSAGVVFCVHRRYVCVRHRRGRLRLAAAFGSGGRRAA